MSAFDQFKLREAEKDAMFGIKSAEENLKLIEQGKAPTMFGRPLTAQDMRMQRTAANNALAQIRSDLRRMEQGDIVFRSEALIKVTRSRQREHHWEVPTSNQILTAATQPQTNMISYMRIQTVRLERLSKRQEQLRQNTALPDRPSLGYARSSSRSILRKNQKCSECLVKNPIQRHRRSCSSNKHR